MVTIKGFEMPASCWDCPLARPTYISMWCSIAPEPLDVSGCDERRSDECRLEEIEDGRTS